MSASPLLAGASAALGVIALGEIAFREAVRVRRRSMAAVLATRAAFERLLRPLHLAGARGLVPTDRERFRLRISAGVAGFATGIVAFGPRAAALASVGLAWSASRMLDVRRARFARRLDAGASAAALAMADALSAGQSVRGALAGAGRSLPGPIGVELTVVARELELGAETERVLGALRRRARSRRIDLIVAAVLLQRRSGGRLATLLRQIAATIDEQDRLLDEARAASAQARFTSLVVLLVPLGGLLLAELSSPGVVANALGSPFGPWLLGAALALQVAGVSLVRRLSRVEP
jgi:tight adherence protein B